MSITILLTAGIILIIGYLFSQSIKTDDIQRRLSILEAELNKIRRKVSADTEPASQPGKDEQETIHKTAAQPYISPAISPETPEEIPAEQQSPLPPPLPDIDISAARQEQAVLSHDELESLIGGKWLNRVGAMAVVIGIGFFLKYAFDHNWITQMARVFIGICIGTGFLIEGARSYKKGLAIYSQGIVGAGVSILFLSVYASYNFYHITPLGAALFSMSVVTVIAFICAFKYDSPAISILGLAGGLITPVLLLSEGLSAIGLFSYLLILNAGIFVVLFKNPKWIILEPIAIIGTYIIYFIWHNGHYSNDKLMLSICFATILWALFYAYDNYAIVKNKISGLDISHIVAVTNAFCYFLVLYILIDKDHHNIMGIIMLVIASVYFMPLLMYKNKGILCDETISQRYTITSIFFLIAATYIQFTGFNIVICWTIEALALVWCGIRWKRDYVWQIALILFAVTFLWLIGTSGPLTHYPDKRFHILFNPRGFSFLLYTVSLAASARLISRSDHKDSQQIQSVLNYSWLVLIFMLLTWETSDYFGKAIKSAIAAKGSGTQLAGELKSIRKSLQLSMSLVWLCYSIVCMVTGILIRNKRFRYMGIIFFAICILKIFFYDLSFLPTLERMFSFIVLGVLLLMVSYLYQKYKKYIFPDS